MKYKFSKIYLITFMLFGTVFSELLYGRVFKEKTIIWDSTTGHSHDGGTEGKQVSFSNLSGTATDGQIPDSITINNADKVDNQHFTDIQADTASQISTHSGNAGVHHGKTTSFADLSDTATDAQIPNTITVDQATNADTVDSQHFTDIQADTASQISTHTGGVSAHHSSISNGLSIIPSIVTTTGDIKINSDSSSDKLLFGTTGDTNLYRIVADALKTDDEMHSGVGFRIAGTDNGAFYKLNATISTGSFVYVDLASEAYARFIIYNSGRMGWGPGTATRDVFIKRNAANQLALEAGDSWYVDTADLYKHGTTTKYMSLSAASMQGYGNTPLYVEYQYVRPTSADNNDDRGQQAVYFPNGVTVTSMVVYGITSASPNSIVNLVLWRIDLDDIGETAMAECLFSNGATSATDSSITVPTIDTILYSYAATLSIRAPSGGSATDTKMYNIRITYTSTDLSQTS